MVYSKIFGRQYKQLRKNFIPLCLKSNDRYYFNILSIVKFFYHLYIEYGMFNLALKIIKGVLDVSLFIKVKRGMLDDDDIFLKSLVDEDIYYM